MSKSNDIFYPLQNNQTLLWSLVFKVTNSFFLISLFFSFNLWFDINRGIPFISIFNSSYLPFINLFFSISLALSLAYNLFRSNKISIFISVLSLICLFFLDKFKCQPWAYFYLATLLICFVAFFYKNYFPFFSIRLLLASMYFWAGIQKLSSQFLSSISYIFYDDFKFVEPFFSVFPYIEIIFGLCIIVFFRSKLIAYFGLVFHTLIVFFIFFSNTNFIIITWNCFFIIIWFLMIYSLRFFNVVFYKSWALILIISLFSFLPILNFFNKYDDYFSFSLYSGKIPLMFLVFKDVSKYPVNLFENSTVSNNTAMRVLKTNSDDIVVSYYKYCINEINVPPVINDAVILRLKKHYSTKFKGCEIIIFRY